MTNQNIRDMISDMGYAGVIIFSNPSYDEAIIGVSDDGRVIYDYEMMIQSLMDDRHISVANAIKYIRLYVIPAAADHPNGPIVMYGIKI